MQLLVSLIFFVSACSAKSEKQPQWAAFHLKEYNQIAGDYCPSFNSLV